MNEEDLQKFIAKVHQVKTKARGNKTEFEAIAYELGMTKEELKEAYTYAEAARERSRELNRSGLYSEALRFALEAHEVKPWDADICALVGGIYKAKGEKSFFPLFTYRKALSWYHKAADIEPKHPTVYEDMRYISARRKAYIKKSILLFGVLLLVAGLVVLFRSPAIRSTVPISASNTAEERKVSTEKDQSSSRQTLLSKPSPESEIPLTALFSAADGISLDLQSSTLFKYKSPKEAFSMKVRGLLRSSNKGIYEISLKQIWYDRSNTKIFEQVDKVLSPPSAPIEPGDVLPINLLVYRQTEAPDIARVSLSLEKLDAENLGKASESVPLPVVWKGLKPSGLDIEFSLRTKQITRSSNKLYARSTLLVTNHGERRLRFLRFTLQYGSGDKQLTGKEKIALSRDGAFIPPKDRYPFFTIDVFEDGDRIEDGVFDSIAVEIAEAE
jgi:tetratricopeptide (TPR) repeat protein